MAEAAAANSSACRRASRTTACMTADIPLTSFWTVRLAPCHCRRRPPFLLTVVAQQLQLPPVRAVGVGCSAPMPSASALSSAARTGMQRFSGSLATQQQAAAIPHLDRILSKNVAKQRKDSESCDCHLKFRESRWLAHPRQRPVPEGGGPSRQSPFQASRDGASLTDPTGADCPPARTARGSAVGASAHGRPQDQQLGRLHYTPRFPR